MPCRRSAVNQAMKSQSTTIALAVPNCEFDAVNSVLCAACSSNNRLCRPPAAAMAGDTRDLEEVMATLKALLARVRNPTDSGTFQAANALQRKEGEEEGEGEGHNHLLSKETREVL